MPRARTRYHHGDLANALVAAAGRAIDRDGVEAFSLREIARAVGVSANAAYRHFADRGDLLAAVAADGFGALAAAIERGRDATTGAVDRLRAVGRAYVAFARASPARFRLMFGPHGAGAGRPDVRGAAGGGRDPFQLLSDALDDAVAAGALDPAARPGAELPLWAAVHGLATLAIDGVVPADPAAVDRVVDAALRGIDVHPGGAPRRRAGAPPREDARLSGARSGARRRPG